MRAKVEQEETWLPRRTRVRLASRWAWWAVPLALVVVTFAELSLATGGVVVLAAFGIATAALATHPRSVRWLVRDLARRRRADAQARREAVLAEEAISRELLLELGGLVEQARDGDVSRAERHDLDGLLDRYVELEVALHRCRHVLASNPRARLTPTGTTATPSTGDLVRARRLAAHDECARAAQRIDAELAALLELIRLFAQRAATPAMPGAIGVVERVVAELEQEDAAADEVARCLPRPHLEAVS